MPSLSPTCLALVKNFEGYQAEPVLLPDGRWLIGHGHVTQDAPAGPTSEKQAEQFLKADLETIAAGVGALAMVSISQCQFDALCCFAFSIGLPAFEGSDVLRFLNAGQPIAAACAMESWRMGGAGGQTVVLDALVRRRAVEKSLFLYEGVRAGAPSALVRPELDPAAAMIAKSPSVRTSQSEEDTARAVRDIISGAPHDEPLAGFADAADLPPPPKRALQPAQRDLIGYVALGVLGLLLIAMGVTGAGDDHGVAHVVFTVPGVIAAIMAAFYLLKSAAT